MTSSTARSYVTGSAVDLGPRLTRVLHLVPGPAEHGVVRHAVSVAGWCGHEVLRIETDVDTVEQLVVPACDVVHVPVTERIFGPDLDRAHIAFGRLTDAVHAAGAALSVTLHDLPHDDSPFQVRRAEFYRAVVTAARGVVVNSDTELDLVTPWAGSVHSLRRIRLPVEPVEPVEPAAAGNSEVTVLGFVFPDRGYEDVIAALPDEATLLALGRASDGHDDLLERYTQLAGGRFRATGFVPDTDLAECLRTAAVPVAPNRRVTASGSINTWLAHGRRPLVPDGPYTREVADALPGALWLYDADNPADLRAAMRTALAEPERTWLGPGVPRGPAPAEVADQYRAHLRSCRPPRARQLPTGGHVVPGNRWDLLPPPSTLPPVSVVVPYFEAQRQLELVLAALNAQTYPADRLEVIVVDDGSRFAPDVSAAGTLAVQVLRQPDEGFRAARARNLGAAAASGDVLAFLDGDTVPEPGYLEALVALPTVCPDAVTVGRRRHADLATHAELPEPRWLVDGYRHSFDLLRVDRRSYRYLISAVLALPARLFAEVGGFDERFVGYGGEDWELANRLYTAGAVFAHVPSAVAWHDGPDWARRPDPVAAQAKNVETLMLAALLPDPDARGGGSWWPYPQIVVRGPTMSDVDALATARSALCAGVDCGLYLAGVTGPRAELVLADPRIQVGSPSDDVLARASCVVDLHAPADLSTLTALGDEADRFGEVRSPALRARSSRALRRVARWSVDPHELFGGHDRSTPRPRVDVDLAAALRRR